MRAKTVCNWWLAIAAIVLITSHAFAAPATPISSCGTVITVPGNYYLANNLSCSGGTAVVIASSKVDLDLRTLMIDGGGGSGYGISTSSAQLSSSNDVVLCLPVSSVHIHGGTVKGYASGAGIILCSPNSPPGPAIAMSVQVDHMRLTANEIGIELITTAKNKIANNYISNNDVGVSLSNGCANNSLVGNLVDGNATGLSLSGPNNTADGNFAVNNTLRGIFVSQVAVSTQTTNNYASHNMIGIEAQEFSAGNVFTGNVAFSNTSADLQDDNGNCTTNSWKGDFFGVGSPACIQ